MIDIEIRSSSKIEYERCRLCHCSYAIVGFATVPMLLHRPTARVRTFCDPTCVTLGGGGTLVFEVGYHP